MIETKDLTKKFGALTAVEGVTLSVAEGEVFGFLGPNGAGKTTTVRMLCSLISRTSGEARIGGYDVGDDEGSLRARKMIGLVSDNVGLYEVLSAYRNLEIYGRLYGVPEARRRENIEKLLTMLGLWEKRDVAAGTFSKGMKQKLAVARALVHDPEVVFMDEPTANLDPESAKTVREFILELKKERRTIFLNTHNLDEAERVCDRIAILNTRLMATGTPGELESMVGGKKVVVELARPSEAVVAALNERYAGFTVAPGGTRLTFAPSDPDGQIPDVVEAVVRAGGRVRYAGVEGSSLESTYLQLVKGEAR
ncbi:MAG: ABC transporter ATP-binding protein [Nitrososphaerota archaeon]|nr:ABC transporter ATP-binding protein [Nitrososphaerota archaeon]MDG6956240.1 ABC transporter ATP-binding protein [Nitrososphaerota archaeon]MDG6957601.1 ABC transporter ATP-binding protein [Nitrososphaerota archaeon]MDG6959748.1 ABC transporter ATP-binding protein [Nitrososphaerota archaeon]MDG6968166.1 ABC transporter ATP-binding protein [Nitrososphaerota archaeon]